ncbi:MAG: ATP-binding protein [Myxococcota bacterium]
MDLATLETWFDALLEGQPLPAPVPGEPPLVQKLRRLEAQCADQRQARKRKREALQELTDSLVHLASLDFDLPPFQGTGDDLVDAARYGVHIMAEELRHAQLSLEEARDAALAANRAKSTFLANMSHELRTPLNAIIGYCELVLEDLPDRDELVQVQKASHHLLSLLSDLLDLSKIEAGRIELAMRPVPVDQLLVEVSETVAPLARAKGLALRQAPPTVTLAAWADAARLRQVLLNLVGNAVKYTERGSVDVTAGLDAGRGPWIEIRDTGIGIPADRMESIFEPFVRVDDHSTAPGTGLGLAISARLCRMMGGEVTVVSELGVGSTFRVALQPPPAEEAACPVR